MKTDLYTKCILTIIAFCLVVIVLQGGITSATARDRVPGVSESPYAVVPINEDGSINVHVKSIDSEQEVVIVGWKESFVDRVYDLTKKPLPVQNK